jgi:L-threonylcarbamoyladenylate synthase
MVDNIYNMIVALQKGDVILHKTDTIWGLACDATNEAAIQKLKELKKHPLDKSLILLISDISQISVFVEKVPDIAWDLVEFAEKPLTVIFPKGKNLPKIALAEDGSVAIRLVKEENCKELIYRFGKPIISTAACIFGEKIPSKFDEITDEIKKSVDFTEKYEGKESIGKPSTIVQLGLNCDFSFVRK